MAYVSFTPRESRIHCQFDGNDGSELSTSTVCGVKRCDKRETESGIVQCCTHKVWNYKKSFILVREDRETPFKDCLATLDNHFTRKANVPFNVQQLDSETIDQFVCRLRQRAILCEIPDKDDAIRDQIIEKFRDPKLRRKFL